MSQITSPDELIARLPTMPEQERAAYLHVLRCITDPLWWMQHGTKTKDEQDPRDPYKPFPDRPYFRELKAAWDAESVLFIEKSRTMMASWFFSGLALHTCMTRPASRILFFAPDEKRSVDLNEKCWTLYEQQDEILKQIWPLERPRDRQRYNMLKLKSDSSIEALPGKNPDKIRSEHPTIIVFDEAGLIEEFGEALDISQAARPLKIVAVTSAYPGEFAELAKTAQPVDWVYTEAVYNA